MNEDAQTERDMADEYARAMGWEDTPEDQAAKFARSTKGAPRVRRPVKPTSRETS